MIPACAVALGGLIGSVARHWLNLAIHARTATTFPLGILVVNVLGCFAMGFIAAFCSVRTPPRPEVVLFLTTGLCGGFTTMSAFSFDTVMLLQQGQEAFALLNVAVTIATCLGAIWLGLTLGRI